MKNLVEHLTRHVQKELNATSSSIWKVTYELEHWNFCFVAETEMKNCERYIVRSRSYDPRHINDIGISGIIIEVATMIAVHYDTITKRMEGNCTLSP